MIKLGVTVDPPAEWENISGEVGTVNWGVEPPNPPRYFPPWFQRLSMIVQHFSSALIVDSFCSTDEDPDL